MAAKTLGESKRGQQYQSIVPVGADERDGVQVADQAMLGDRQVAHLRSPSGHDQSY
jgi:hypothetical protein